MKTDLRRHGGGISIQQLRLIDKLFRGSDDGIKESGFATQHFYLLYFAVFTDGYRQIDGPSFPYEGPRQFRVISRNL